ncbi:uncharacterized protein LAJ45_02447 [Morchella importuna]|uniref:uncharacterized protein n=1 Tax=Morchella importuna TaxID=1174673 RepID=UPI001E8E98F7|nr:uncharacterized protein LAJ45_02447 [Morchella importuna]KAH8153634.1 hypothetical protein LAJ45_02447 [Morchella importuna]
MPRRGENHQWQAANDKTEKWCPRSGANGWSGREYLVYLFGPSWPTSTPRSYKYLATTSSPSYSTHQIC